MHEVAGLLLHPSTRIKPLVYCPWSITQIRLAPFFQLLMHKGGMINCILQLLFLILQLDPTSLLVFCPPPLRMLVSTALSFYYFWS